MSEQQLEPKQIRPSEPVYDVEQGIDLEKPLSKQGEPSALSKFAQKVVEQHENKAQEEKLVEKTKVATKEQPMGARPSVTTTEERVFEPEAKPEAEGIEGGLVNLDALASIAPVRGSVVGLAEKEHPSLNTIQRQIGQLASANHLPSLWGMTDDEKNASEIVATKIVELSRQAKQISPDLNVRAFISNARGASEYPDAEQYLTAIEDEIYGTALKNELFETHANTRGDSIADNQIHEKFEALDHPVTKFENNAGLVLDRDQETAYGDNYVDYKQSSLQEPETKDEFEKDKEYNIATGKFRNVKAKPTDKITRLEKKLRKYDERLRIKELRNAVKLAESAAKDVT